MAPPKTTLKGVVLLQKKHTLDFTNIAADLLDDAADLVGQKVKLQLISEDLDPGTRSVKTSLEVAIGGWYFAADGVAAGDIKYEIDFTVDSGFGTPGAFFVKNNHPNEFYLRSLTLAMPDGRQLHFPCESWVFNVSKYATPRVFFRNQVYLPGTTPPGLKEIRSKELAALRGNGSGTRVTGERIYDYDVYNDLGNPDSNKQLLRPVLGGGKLQYPRRVRTGRKPARTDSKSESFSSDDFYLPYDETTARIRSSSVLGDSIKAFVQKIIPAIKTFFADQTASFESFEEIKGLYAEGMELGSCVNPLSDDEAKNKMQSPFTLISELTSDDDANPGLLKYPEPQILAGDDDAWMSDDEFARQTLAGLNPMVIQKLKAFPPPSILDAAVFGAEASALKAEHIQNQLQGLTVEQALTSERLFVLDYHDVFLPYLNIINAQPGKRTYGTRTIFFLTDAGTLKLVAIELSLPAPGEKGQRKNRVFVPPTPGKKDWLWELAKAHVSINDAGYHQLVSHWLKTHATMEPIIIATNRQLSALHPIYLLLLPHFKNTMAINARARRALINASGIIEDCFTTGKYSMEMCAVVYGKFWRFDEEGLPADLIKRGMAVPKPNSKHGLDLVIKDYPYAVDGLNIWDSLKTWVKEYTEIFYKDDAAVKGDTELQAWWNEIRTIGHADKKDADWWVKLDTRKNLVETLTTIIWLASAHHAAVNFGQYAYAGYPVNRPTCGHRFVPEPGTKEHQEFLKNPEKFYLSAISSRVEATTVMTTIEILSTHTADEEYLGERKTENWTSNESILGAFSRFTSSIRETERQVQARNRDPSLKNRSGAVKSYTLLCVNSKPGLTGRGIPNSISI